MAGILGDYLPAPADAPADPRQNFSLPDIFRSLGGGLQQGGSALAGFPGDLRDAAVGGVNDLYRYLAPQFGMSPERIAQVQQDAAAFMQRQPGLFPQLPTYLGMLQSAGAAFGPPHQPQTHLGTFAQRLGQALPGLPFGMAGGDFGPPASNGNHAGSPNAAVPDRMRY